MWYHSSVKWKVNLYVQIWLAWASSRPQTVLSYIEENPLFMDSVHWLHELVWIQAFFVFTEANEKSDTITSCIKWILNKKNWVKRMLQIFHYTTASWPYSCPGQWQWALPCICRWYQRCTRFSHLASLTNFMSVAVVVLPSDNWHMPFFIALIFR